ncbi:MAG: acyl-CoA dehydrogenase [Rhodobacteraceae bacterium]|nr:acyl-CoA dehydrogenase [Paracoccaceae bacterium]MYG42174.1 acyl-CoA dehydrogenase [Paracoccaceae bacterium]
MTLFTQTSTWNQEEHSMFSDSVKRFYVDHLVPNMQRFDTEGMVDRDFWKKAGEIGIMGGSVPEEYEGSGGSYGFDSIALYEQGKIGDGSWGYGIQSIVIHYLIKYGSHEQKAYWLPQLVSGESIGALAMTEPGCGSDVQSIQTQAEKKGNHYLINGSKTFITNGGSADLIILTTKTEASKGAQGVSLILVDTRELEGFRRGPRMNKLGQRGNDTAELFFDNVMVPRTNLLGEEEGQGFYQLMKQLPWERLLIGITALGTIDFALEQTISYVQERKAFGKRLMDLQNTRFKLAEAKTKAELLRTFVNDCIQRIENNELDAATASMVKYWGSETQNQIINECLQLHGGYGYMLDYPIARLYADSRVQMIYGGSNEIMKELIARSIDN